VNPYASPAAPSYSAPAYSGAAERVAGPAMALLIVGILSVLFKLVGIVGIAVAIVADPAMAQQNNNGPLPMAAELGLNIAMTILGLILSSLIIYGALQMRRLESFSASMAAAIVAMLPCIFPCCVLGFPFGIWALVVLNDPSVKAAFR
jgi:hypothetical protein